MTDHELERRLRAWYGAEIGIAEPAPPSLYDSVATIPEASHRRTVTPSARPRVLLLAAAAVLVTLVAGAVAIGSGVVKLPVVEPPATIPATASPSVQASPSGAPSSPPTASPSVQAAPPRAPGEGPWMTGQELMDVLSEEFDYVWQETVVGGFSPEAGMTERTVYMYGATMVDQPFDFAATAYASAEADAHADRGAIDILTQLLAPDMATWIADALEQGLSSEETFSVTTKTPSGGYVTAQVVREKLVQDWVNVTFSPVDPRLQEP